MDLSECIGRYSVRKSLRFGMVPVAGTENFVYDTVYASEELAECLNPVKDVILAKHIAMVRRVCIASSKKSKIFLNDYKAAATQVTFPV